MLRYLTFCSGNHFLIRKLKKDLPGSLFSRILSRTRLTGVPLRVPSLYTPPYTTLYTPVHRQLPGSCPPCHRAVCHFDPRSGRTRRFPDHLFEAKNLPRHLSVTWSTGTNDLSMPGKMRKVLQNREILFSVKRDPSGDEELIRSSWP